MNTLTENMHFLVLHLLTLGQYFRAVHEENNDKEADGHNDSDPKKERIIAGKEIRKPPDNTKPQDHHDKFLNLYGAGGIYKDPVLCFSFRLSVPDEIGDQLRNRNGEQAQIRKPGDHPAGTGEKIDGYEIDSGKGVTAHQDAKGKQEIVARQVILLAGPVKGVHFHDGICLQRDWGFLLVVEHLHLMPGTGELPACVGAEVVEGLLILRGTGIKVGSSGIIGHAEMDVLWIDPAVGPVEIGDALE